jgi:hypothetical protein
MKRLFTDKYVTHFVNVGVKLLKMGTNRISNCKTEDPFKYVGTFVP